MTFVPRSGDNFPLPRVSHTIDRHSRHLAGRQRLTPGAVRRAGGAVGTGRILPTRKSRCRNL